METVYLIAFFLGLGFAVLSGLFSGVFGGADADVGGAGGDVDLGGVGADHGGFDIEGTHVDVQAGPDIHFPLVSPVTLSTFVASFGGMGVIGIKALEWPLHLHLPVAAGTGIGVAAAVWFLFYKLFGRATVSSAPSRDQLIGIEAKVLLTIPADGAGQIAYMHAGTRYQAPARSAGGTEIPTGAAVRIESISGGVFHVRKP